jgi:hydrogenase nickel incorporation protein HypA/HybF
MVMHEVSLIESVVALVEQQWAKAAFERVKVIRLQVGALGPAEPDALRFCFDAVIFGTIAQGSRLEIELIQGSGWCPDCRTDVALDDRFGACPACGGGRVHMTSGGVLRLAELEVE